MEKRTKFKRKIYENYVVKSEEEKEELAYLIYSHYNTYGYPTALLEKKNKIRFRIIIPALYKEYSKHQFKMITLKLRYNKKRNQSKRSYNYKYSYV